MRASKRIEITRTNIKAVGTGLASHMRTNLDNSDSLQLGFVSGKLLELVESPRVKPSVKSFTFKFVPSFSYSLKIFKYNTICTIDNLFTYDVVNPTHIAFLPTRDLFKKPFGRLCAFTLEFSPQVLELDNLGFVTFENLAITTDSKIIYSEVNTNNPVATRSSGIDLSR